MNRTRWVALAALLGIGAVARPQALGGSFFYGGDPNGVNALTSEWDTEVTDSLVVDDFQVTKKTKVSSVYGRFVSNIDNPRGFDWFILQNVSSGNGGTVVQSGVGVAGSWTKDGHDAFGLTGRLAKFDTDFDLDPGLYSVGIRVRSEVTGEGRAFIQQTSGADSVGGPIADGNSFVNSTFYGWNWLPVESYTGEKTDFSYGLTTVPEPPLPLLFGAMATLTCLARTARKGGRASGWRHRCLTLLGLSLLGGAALAQGGGNVIRGAHDVCVGESMNLRVVPPSANGVTIWTCEPSDRLTFSPPASYNTTTATGNKPSDTKDDVTITALFIPVTSIGLPIGYKWTTKVSVVQVDVKTYKPKVIDSAEPETARDMMQTWVNLDNDNRNDKYDLDEEDTPEDNEVAKVEVVLKPNDYDKGKVTLTVEGGSPNAIKLYKQNKKDKIALPFEMSVKDDMTTEGDFKRRRLFLEGVAPHTTQKDTTLKAVFLNGTSTCEGKNKVTILGVKTSQWLGKKNSKNLDDTLTADDNWTVAAFDAKSVFPGFQRKADKTIDKTDRHDKVELEWELTVKPVEKVKLSFRSHDIDDVTDNDAPVDPNDKGGAGNYERSYPGAPLRSYTDDDDNRGSVDGNKAGKMTGEDATTKIKEVEFEDTKAKLEFQVSMQPGDNYRIVANADKEFLKILRNKDKDDGVNIVDPKVGDGAAGLIKNQKEYGSPGLTVWRHVWYEKDRMKAFDETNQYEGEVTEIDSNDSANVKKVTVNPDPRDKSDDFDSGTPAPGRFEKGTIKFAGTQEVADIDGNGKDYFRKNAGMDICGTGLPFELVDKTGANLVTGKITKIDNKRELVTDLDTGVGVDYKGGSITIGGGSTMDVTDLLNAGKTLKVNRLRIKLTGYDDDTAIGTRPPASDFGKLDEVYKPGFVMFREETVNPKPDTDFVRNIPFANTKDNWQFDNKDDENIPEYWLIYIQQGSQYDTDSDSDPGDKDGVDKLLGGMATTAEGMTLGNVDKIGTGLGLNMHEEAIKPLELNPNDAKGISPAYTLAHEVGHLFGGIHHGPAAGQDGGIMAQTSTRASNKFTGRTINRVRSINNP